MTLHICNNDRAETRTNGGQIISLDGVGIAGPSARSCSSHPFTKSLSWVRTSAVSVGTQLRLFVLGMDRPNDFRLSIVVASNNLYRWATLGSFYTFFRNHAEISANPQEFYRWPKVAEAARKGISIRYTLRKFSSRHRPKISFPSDNHSQVDYIYTALYKQNQTGTPALNPLFFNYPDDPNTYPIDLQFFYGDGILVSPVTEEDSTTVNFYLPDDIFYEWATGKPVRGHGEYVSADVDVTDIKLHYKGGIIYPQRVESANTTAALRKKGFNIVVAPGLDGSAEGSLYLDDGESVMQDAVSEIDFKYAGGKFTMTGSFEFDAGVNIETITILGVEQEPSAVDDADYDAENKKLVLHVNVPFTGSYKLSIA